MSIADIAVWLVRAVGALWIVGGVLLLRQLYFNTRLDALIETLERMAADPDGEGAPETLDDKGRERWLAAGAALTIASGAAMALAHKAAVACLAALIIQQLLYFVRQRRRELAAPTPEAALGERPTRQTINGFFTSLIMATLAAWLFHEGKLF